MESIWGCRPLQDLPAIVDMLFSVPLPGADLQRVMHRDCRTDAVLIIPPQAGLDTAVKNLQRLVV